jgi:Uma2 family endonuclease
MTTFTATKITVAELFEMELEEGYFYELINGNIVKKQAPSPQHQEAVGQIFKALDNFVRANHLGKAYIAPIDVFFDKYNNTQPDISFVSKDCSFLVTQNGIEGAPDLIVEVISPSSFRIDRKDKMETYLEFGVKEYWLVDPRSKSVEINVLTNDRYILHTAVSEIGEVESKLLTGFKLDITAIFE